MISHGFMRSHIGLFPNILPKRRARNRQVILQLLVAYATSSKGA